MELKTYLEKYIQSNLKKKDRFGKSIEISFDEVVGRVEDFVSEPTPQRLITLLRGLTTSGIYISRSFLKYLFSYIQFKQKENLKLSEQDKKLLSHVLSGEPIDTHIAAPKDIFNAIFKNQLITHESPDEDVVSIELNAFKSTIVLVPGILNEIFSTAAYERGVQHLTSSLGVHYICPKVFGTKSVDHNSKLLKDQLLSYIDEHPKEKLWMIAFSKGGLDTLHFLADNPEFAKRNIHGVSMISSPILGASHLNHKILKFINSLHNYSDNSIYKFFEKQSDLLFKELQKSMSKEHQKNWFSNNHETLPDLDFYTALAMESEWTESHFWMMLTKAFFQNQKINDGIVEAENALFPDYFKAHNLGVFNGHHLAGTRSSTFNQEALLESHVIYLQYLKYLN